MQPMASVVKSETTPLLSSVGGSIPEKDKSLGDKTISSFGSYVLTINNLSGPGMLAVPIVFQQAGWLVPLVFLILMYILSSLAATLLTEAMTLIPGNEAYGRRIEFSTIVEHMYGRKAYIVTQCVYSMSLQTLNIASIIVSAQVMDQFLVRVAGKSYALALESGHFVDTTDLVTPFAGAGMVITLGYLVVTVLCMPIGFLNLSEGIIFQYVSFFILIVGMIEFFVQYCMLDLELSRVKVIGDNMSQVVGTILFNYTFIVTVPSWVNEKMDSVSVNKTIWFSGLFTTVGYFVMGYVGALAYGTVSSNVLTTFASSGHVVTEITAYFFSLGVIGLGIPLFSIMVRYNLYVGGVFGPKLSGFFGVVAPWLVSWPLYQGNGFGYFVSWSSLFVNSFINFGLPMLIYVTARKRYAEHVTSGGEVHLPPGSRPAAKGKPTTKELLSSLNGPSGTVPPGRSHSVSDRPGASVINDAETGSLYDNPYDFFYSPVDALPRFLRSFTRSVKLARFLLFAVIILTICAIVFQFLTTFDVISES